MITPRALVATAEVAAHYDDLDVYYRKLWGEHLHHGLWLSGRESPQVAVENLMRRVADQLAIEPGERVCDVGCGYGGTSRYLSRVHGAQVVGLTVSRAQFEYAVHQAPNGQPQPQYLLAPWEENGFADACFDGVVSIECLAHVHDKQRFFDEIYRVLKTGKRGVIAAWLEGPRHRRWQQRHLLEPICWEGRLPGMGTQQDYSELIARAGLRLLEFQDLSRSVRRTWRICARRVVTRLLVDAEARRFVLQRRSRDARFALTVGRILVAYYLGVMGYGLFVVEKPQ